MLRTFLVSLVALLAVPATALAAAGDVHKDRTTEIMLGIIFVLLRTFDPKLAPGEEPDVADPYYGGGRGFTEVLEQVERSCAALLERIADALETGKPL